MQQVFIYSIIRVDEDNQPVSRPCQLICFDQYFQVGDVVKNPTRNRKGTFLIAACAVKHDREDI